MKPGDAARNCRTKPFAASFLRYSFFAPNNSLPLGCQFGGNSCISRGLVIKDGSVSGPKARICEQLPPTASRRARPRCYLDHYGRRGSLNRISEEHSLATRIAANLRNDVGSGVLSPKNRVQNTQALVNRKWSRRGDKFQRNRLAGSRCGKVMKLQISSSADQRKG